jgi:hypothetical protein
MPRPRLLAPLVLLVLAPAAAADAPPAEAAPVTPTSRLRLQNFQNFGHLGRLTLAPDGRSLVMPNGNGVTVWDIRPGKRNVQPRFLQMENAYFHDSALALSADGATLVGAPAFHMNDSSIRFWELGAAKEARQIDNDEPVFGLALSPDGKKLAVATQQRLELWDAATGDELRVLDGGLVAVPPGNMQQRPVITFSPDGRMLATSGPDATVVLWETATGKERQRIRMRRPPLPPMMNGFRQPAQHPAASAALSAGGRLLAVGGADNAVHLWDLRTGRELPPLGEHGAPVQGVVFPPGGRELVSFDGEGVRLAWDVRRLLRAGAPAPARPLDREELDALWDDLAGDDPGALYRATRRLAADPKAAVPFLREHVKPVPAGDVARFSRLVADLQNGTPAVRRKAMGELRKGGEPALAALTQVPDVQKHNRAFQAVFPKLEAACDTPERARALRAVQILEEVGTPEARKLLEGLAGGLPGARLTAEAKEALAHRAPTTGGADAATPEPSDPQKLWAALADDDAAKAWRAARALAAAPGPTLALFGEHLKPAEGPDTKKVEGLIADLDNGAFADREKATEELTRLGEPAREALRKALESGPGPEARRRIEQILKRSGPGQPPPGKTMQGLRAVEVLEWLGTDEARALLAKLADGSPGAALTRDAKATLARLGRGK